MSRCSWRPDLAAGARKERRVVYSAHSLLLKKLSEIKYLQPQCTPEPDYGNVGCLLIKTALQISCSSEMLRAGADQSNELFGKQVTAGDTQCCSVGKPQDTSKTSSVYAFFGVALSS